MLGALERLEPGMARGASPLMGSDLRRWEWFGDPMIFPVASELAVDA